MIKQFYFKKIHFSISTQFKRKTLIYRVLVVVVENKHKDSNSKPKQGYLYFT